MTRFVLIFSGAVFLGGIGAFFAFIPPLLIASVAFLLMAFLFIFVLGIQVGTESTLPAGSVTAKPLSQQVEIRPARL